MFTVIYTVRNNLAPREAHCIAPGPETEQLRYVQKHIPEQLQRASVIFGLLFFLNAPGLLRGGPAPAAIATFDSYIKTMESRLAQQHRSQNAFLAPAVSDSDGAEARLRRGELIVERLTPSKGAEFSGALLHHWRGTAFAPGSEAADFERLMRDFNVFPRHFAPQVLNARVFAQRGDRMKVSMRVRQRHVITVVMDTTCDMTFGQLDLRHGYSISRSSRIAEIVSPGTSAERTLNADQEHGFLWRLNTYWSYEERDGGLYLQIEAVSLTRAIPPGLGWAIRPYVEEHSARFAGIHASRSALQAALFGKDTEGMNITGSRNEKSGAFYAGAPRQSGADRLDREARFAMDGRVALPIGSLQTSSLLLGLSAQIGAGIGYALSRYNRYALVLVILCLVLNWFGDSMDGTLARVRCQPRPRYGFYVDHMVDIFGSVALMCGLGFSGFLHWQTAVAMLIAFLLLSGESYLATYTLSRLSAVAGNLRPYGDSHSADPRQPGVAAQPIFNNIRPQDAAVRSGQEQSRLYVCLRRPSSSPCTIRLSCTARNRCRERVQPLVEVQCGGCDGHGGAACRARSF